MCLLVFVHYWIILLLITVPGPPPQIVFECSKVWDKYGSFNISARWTLPNSTQLLETIRHFVVNPILKDTRLFGAFGIIRRYNTHTVPTEVSIQNCSSVCGRELERMQWIWHLNYTFYILWYILAEKVDLLACMMTRGIISYPGWQNEIQSYAGTFQTTAHQNLQIWSGSKFVVMICSSWNTDYHEAQLATMILMCTHSAATLTLMFCQNYNLHLLNVMLTASLEQKRRQSISGEMYRVCRVA